jgi:ClpP class serine protease
MAQEKSKFQQPGLLGIEPSAFGLEYVILRAFGEPFCLVANEKAAVVDICGPLTYSGGLFDSYSAIKGRVAAALASPAQYVILKVSSPGGEVAGAFDCARALRAMAAKAGKTLLGYTDSGVHSSAYALISAASKIVASSSAGLGSIGVIHAVIDASKADAAMGVAFHMVKSGARKADGNLHVPFSDDALEAIQRTVDDTAAVFFQLIKDHRSFDPEPLQASCYVGERARSVGLCDAIMSWEEFLGAVDTGAFSSLAAGDTMADKSDDKDAIRASLVNAANSEDKEKAARAKRALAAYDEDKDEEKSKAESEDDKKDARKAESDDEKKDDKKEDARAASASAPLATVAALAADLAAANAKIAALQAKADADAKAADAAARAALFASRPDLSEALKASLASTPLAQATAIIAAIPKAFVNPAAAESSAAASAAIGAGQPVAMSPNVDLDRLMGLASVSDAVIDSGAVQTFGVKTFKPYAPPASVPAKG